MRSVSRLGIAALLAGAVAAPIAFAHDPEPGDQAGGGMMSGMMSEDGMGMMPMMRMMREMGPMMESCLAMMEAHDVEEQNAPESAPEAPVE